MKALLVAFLLSAVFGQSQPTTSPIEEPASAPTVDEVCELVCETGAKSTDTFDQIMKDQAKQAVATGLMSPAEAWDFVDLYIENRKGPDSPIDQLRQAYQRAKTTAHAMQDAAARMREAEIARMEQELQDKKDQLAKIKAAFAAYNPSAGGGQ